jgi:putative tryptophan/tyrosine transport system substrate-binding protein
LQKTTPENLSASRPFAARAQQPAMPVIGLLQIGAPSCWDFAGFRQGLKDTGYVEGPNLSIEVPWANDDPGRLPELALLPRTGNWRTR